MYFIKSKKIFSAVFTIVVVLGLATRANADFLELPDIKEMRDIRSKTYLRDMEIPAVRERSPDPTAGPRLGVSEFRVQGLVEYPDLGITREALNTLVEGIRFEVMREGKLLESGYTINELGQISDLLVEIEEDTLDRHVTPLDTQKLVYLIREQRGKRGVTLGQIETVANKITSFYRERGFILAKAYIPKQQVRDGIVNLTLLLGMLGEVNVANNKLYSADKLKSTFDDLMGKPVTNAAVEERLYLINDSPGINVEGYFEPGYQVGDSRLNINVREEEKYSSNVRIDNHGSEETGMYRLYADFQANNLLDRADSLSAAVLEASSPSNTLYWRLKYGMDLFIPQIKVDIEVSKNQFLIDKSASTPLDIHGDVNLTALTGKYIFKRGRTENSNLELRYEEIASDLQLGDIPDVTNAYDEKLKNISLNYNYDFLQETKSRLHQGNVKLLSGSFDYGADSSQDENYLILSSGYTLLSFWKIPFFESNSRVVVRANAQYSGKNLSSAMRFSLAGPTRARGFPTSLFTADDGVYVGADWVFNSPDLFDFNLTESINFKNVAKPFLFIDGSKGIQHTLASGEANATAQIFDAGFGLQFSSGKHFQGNLQFAFPISESFSTMTTMADHKSVHVVFDFQYGF
jgi:hemolysin activation/secretion protein